MNILHSIRTHRLTPSHPPRLLRLITYSKHFLSTSYRHDHPHIPFPLGAVEFGGVDEDHISHTSARAKEGVVRVVVSESIGCVVFSESIGCVVVSESIWCVVFSESIGCVVVSESRGCC